MAGRRHNVARTFTQGSAKAGNTVSALDRGFDTDEFGFDGVLAEVENAETFEGGEVVVVSCVRAAGRRGVQDSILPIDHVAVPMAGGDKSQAVFREQVDHPVGISYLAKGARVKVVMGE